MYFARVLKMLNATMKVVVRMPSKSGVRWRVAELLFEIRRVCSGSTPPCIFTVGCLVDVPPLFTFSKIFHPGHSYSSPPPINFWKKDLS